MERIWVLHMVVQTREEHGEYQNIHTKTHNIFTHTIDVHEKGIYTSEFWRLSSSTNLTGLIFTSFTFLNYIIIKYQI
ncbi:hypothetical protein HanIR_Chr17g0891601 [Helianthus annuus]|nr:hypothetical protein HanIR_Chr17g0891601 [Helianthus annuus]